MLRVEALFALQRRSELLDAADLVPGSTYLALSPSPLPVFPRRLGLSH